MNTVAVERAPFRYPVAVQRTTTQGDPPDDPTLPTQAVDVLVSGRPTTLYARWSADSAQRTEGQSWTVKIVLNRPVAVPSVALIVADAASTADLAQVSFPAEVEFGFGELEKEIEVTTTGTAANAGTQTLVLKIDPEADTTSSLTPLGTRPEFGPDTATLTIIDDPATTIPTWTLVPGAATTPEGAGALTYSVELDVPAVDDVQVDIGVGAATTATLSTGPSNGDFQAFGQIVTIPAGEQSATFDIVYVDNAVDAPIDPVLEVTGEIQSGTVTNSAGQSWSTTIEDNDAASSGPPRVRFFASAVARQAGARVSITAQLRDVDGNPAGFSQRTAVPLDRTLSSGVTANDFTVEWGANDPNTVTFGPGADTTTFHINIGADVAAGEFIQFQVQSSPTNLWTPGTIDTVTLTVAAAEVTLLMVPGMEGGSRRMVQGQFAIDPPSLTIPELSLGTGERVQCVGQKKNGGDQWISGYFYGLTSGDESVPGTSNETELRLADVGDATPAESGTFTPTFAPVVSFDVRVANVALPYECSTALANGDKLIRWTQPDNLGGFDPAFPQVGPDLVRERVYSMRPVLQGVTPANGLTSGDALGLVEVCETRIAGEANVFLFEGRWCNGAWDASADPEAPNPMVDGEVYLDSIAASVPAGYEIRFGTASPLQTGEATDSVELLTDRAEDYLSTVCSSYTFRFAVVTAGDADARLRADGYLAEKNIATAVGPLGPTRKGISGEASEPIIDWGRAGLSANGLNGWRAVKSLGEAQGAAAQTAWANGNARVSWLLTQGPGGSGSSGGTLIDGSNNRLPWWGQWLTARHALHACAGRHNYSYRDVETGDAPWWWKLARDVNGNLEVPFLGSLFTRRGHKRHWHFNTPDNTVGSDLYNDSNLAAYQLGPTGRAWNTAATEDPNATALRDTWVAENVTHFARLRLGLDQTWEGMRSWLAYTVREEVAAFLSRVFAPVEVSNANARAIRDERRTTGLVGINAFLAANPEFQRLGLHAVDSQNDSRQGQGTNVRAWAWAAYFLQGFYSLATQDTRLEMRGQGTGVTSGRSLLRTLWTYFALVTTDAGLMARAYPGGANPDPFGHSGFNAPVPDNMPTPDFTTRTGGLPHLQANSVAASVTEHFHQVFFQHMVTPYKKHVWTSFSPELSQLDRVLNYHDLHIQGQRTIGAGGRDLSMSYMLLSSIGPTPIAPVAQAAQIDRVTAQETADGEVAWRLIALGGSQDMGWNNHFQKSGWTSLAAADGLDDESMLYIAKDVWGRQGDTDEEFVEHVMGATITPALTGASSGTEWTFMVPYIATLVNRYS